MFKNSKQQFSFEPRWYAVFVFFVCGIFMGAFVLFVWIFNGGKFYGIQKIHPGNSHYKFINPLIAVENEQVTDFFVNESLQQKLSAILETRQRSRDIQNGAVYFRELDSGRWVGVNEDLRFSPGKLLKIPIMIAYYKLAQVSPSELQKKLVYKDDSETDSDGLSDGKMYTIEELILDMLSNENGNSANILYDNIDKKALNEVFSDLGINFKEDKETDDYLTLKQYSLFFRVLYNATFLNRQYSELALSNLSQIGNSKGIAASLPNDLVISHKYRTRSFVQNGSQLQESHDCGVIYYPNHPYLLCTMAIGKNTQTIANIFKEISKTVYQDMVKKYKN